MRNAVSRRRWESVADENSISSKISRSGRNEIVVPVSFGLADDLEVGLRDAARELLAIDLPVAPDLGHEPLAERVDDRDADAVETAGDLVAVAAELPAGVQLRQDDGERGLPLVLHHVDRDAAAGVGDGDRVVRVDGDLDDLVVAGHGLVDGVVDELVDEVVKPSRAGRADVHAGSQTDGLEAFEDRDVLSGIGGVCHKPPERKNACKTGVLRASVKYIRHRGRDAPPRGSRRRLSARPRGGPDPRSRRSAHAASSTSAAVGSTTLAARPRTALLRAPARARTGAPAASPRRGRPGASRGPRRPSGRARRPRSTTPC